MVSNSVHINELAKLVKEQQDQKLINLCSENFIKKLSSYNAYRYAQKSCEIATRRTPIKNPMLTNSFLTVVTVNYNNLNGLKATINSVRKQTERGNIQHIVVDGLSNDGSLDFLKGVEKEIDIAVFGQDCGVYDAMNRGVQLADSEYMIFMNSGDCFDSDTIVEKFIELAKSEISPDFIYGAARLDNGTVWHPLKHENLWKGMICSHQSAFFKTSKIKDIGYSTHNQIVSDYELIAKLYSKDSTFLKTSLVISKIEPVGISADFYTRTIERWKVIRGMALKNVLLGEIDDFYRTLLSTKGHWAAPHNYSINKPQAQLISNIENRVCFLISMPRSGSTLLQRIIDKSPDIETAGEPWFMLPLASMYSDNLITAKYGQHLNIMAKDAFEEDTKLSGIIRSAQKTYADSIYSTAVNAFGKRYFLDKTPRYVHIIDELTKIYPKAKFIVLLRNPAAVISSYANTWFGGDYGKTVSDQYSKFDFNEGFQKLADFANSDFNNKIVVNYEKLVTEPETEAKKIFKYLGVPFSEEFINYNNQDMKKFTFGDPSAVYQKNRPDPKNNDKWLDSLTSATQAKAFLTSIEEVPEAACKALGYSKEHTITAVNKKFSLLLPSLPDLVIKYKGEPTVGGAAERNHFEAGKFELSIGVLITSYNNKFTIRDSIESVVNQTRKPDLIVIADDNSNDGSQAIIKCLIGANPQINIQLIERTENVGVARNRDEAIMGMKTDYITTLDGDDIYFPYKLEKESNALVGHEGSIAFSDIIILSEDKDNFINTSDYDRQSKSKMLQMLCSRSSPVPRDMLFPKKLFLKSDGFDLDMEVYEDWSLKMRLMANLDEEQHWIHSKTIGTVYDRRNPGLSSRAPIYHAYGQFLAVARNVDFLLNADSALLAGIRTVTQQLEGNVQARMLLLLEQAEKSKSLNNLYIALKNIWFERSWSSTTKELNELFWTFGSLEFDENNTTSETTINNFSPRTKIFVVTPVYNAVTTIERTIMSVINQKGSFDIEYCIQDGGSTDGTLAKIKEIDNCLKTGKIKKSCLSIKFTYTSKNDNGMYDAIVKGFNSFELHDPDWLTWINADDYLEDKSFARISTLNHFYDRKIQWVTGTSSVIELDGKINRSFRPLNKGIIKRGLADGKNWNFVQQEGTFFRAELWKKVCAEKVLSSFRYAGDWNLWRNFAQYEDIYLDRLVLANFCKSEGQLSSMHLDDYYKEIDSIVSFEKRTSDLSSFPVSEGHQLILENKDNRIMIKKGSILGQFASVFLDKT
jgi:glycosyltransferase involved in cell wall biosynthesis